MSNNAPTISRVMITSLVGYIHTLANVNPDIFLAQASDYPNKDKEHLDNKQLLAF